MLRETSSGWPLSGGHDNRGWSELSVSLQALCVAEFQFRFNTRTNADIFGEAVRGF